MNVSVPLSSADILALSVTPIELVPAPGPGKAIVILGAAISYSFGTIAYTSTGGAFTRYAGALAADLQIMSGNELKAGQSTFSAIGTSYLGGANPPSDYVDQAVQFTATAPFVAGDGTAIVSVAYVIVDA